LFPGLFPGLVFNTPMPNAQAASYLAPRAVFANPTSVYPSTL
jgi:hypothetical protein